MNLSQFNRILLQTLLLPVVALLLVAAVLVWQLMAAQESAVAVQQTHDRITAATRVSKLVVDEETGLRGYQITRDPSFLQPYSKASGALDEALTQLRAAVAAGGRSTTTVDEIASAQRTWKETFAQPLMATIAGGGNTRDVELNRQGRERMDALRSRIDDLILQETAVRERSLARWKLESKNTIRAMLLMSVLVGTAIGIFTVSRLHRVSTAYQNTLDGLRRQAQATFRSEERLRTTLRSVGDGVIVCSTNGVVELLNTAAEELTGWTQEEAYQRPLTEVFHIVNERTRDLVETPVERVKKMNRVVGLANHTVLIRRDGSEIQIDDSGAPIRDRSGEMVGVVMVFRDVTEQKRTQDALMASEKLAVAGRLAATIAHEIHNPLDAVTNLLYLMRTETDRVTSAHYVDLAQRELSRIGHISRALLGLYRESKMPVAVDLKDVIESVLVLLERQIRHSKLTVKVEMDGSMKVEGFPAELRQVFTNLVANAVEASVPGGEIRITGQRHRPAGGLPGVVVEVRDNGVGIAEEALQHLFEPFFTTKGENGTGLGLWVSRGIVEKHGGKVEVHSSMSDGQRGTMMQVFLPDHVTGVPTEAAPVETA